MLSEISEVTDNGGTSIRAGKAEAENSYHWGKIQVWVGGSLLLLLLLVDGVLAD